MYVDMEVGIHVVILVVFLSVFGYIGFFVFWFKVFFLLCICEAVWIILIIVLLGLTFFVFRFFHV